MIEAAALAAAGSRNGLFMTFVNDGRSQHTFLITDYDPATAMFMYFRTRPDNTACSRPATILPVSKPCRDPEAGRSRRTSSKRCCPQ